MTRPNGLQERARRGGPSNVELALRARRTETVLLMGWLLAGMGAFAFWFLSFALEAKARFESLLGTFDGR